MANWNTMHVFGYGQSQMIGPDKNGFAASDTLNTLGSMITYLASQQQEGTNVSLQTLFALNIFNGQFVDFLPNSKDNNQMQRFKWVDLDPATIDAFADELSAAIPELEVA